MNVNNAKFQKFDSTRISRELPLAIVFVLVLKWEMGIGMFFKKLQLFRHFR